MRKNIIKIIFILIITLLLGIAYGVINSKVYAATISSDIDAIDDAKYPGVKSKLKEIQSKHPNWTIKVYYTQISWNNAVAAEYTGHRLSPKSLIYDTYSIGWRCPICGNQKYDVSGRYYCASEEAIKYMMDPRNSLDDEYIFQFQNLSSSVGDRSAIEKMVQGTFLNVPSYIDAIMEAAQTEQISPFHLVSRIKQEQGSDGRGAMNGYQYQTDSGEIVTVYNLFNIKVSGNDTEAGLLAGAKYAYEQGWTTPEASIKGGAKFLKEGYLNEGQSTLYFQKFDVVDNGTTYFDNQYMQNIRAANDEGNSMYKTYNSVGIVNSSFEFIIPLYENMPEEACPRPIDDYVGTINTELIDLNSIISNGKNYMSGYIYIAEWINGNCNTPWETPKMTLKSTDGKVQYSMYVSHQDSIKYYFDRNLEDVDTSKEYYIEVELQGDRNKAPEESKKQIVNLKGDRVLNDDVNGKTLKITNNKIVFSEGKYEGTINTTLRSVGLVQNGNGEYYISGYVDIGEYIGAGNSCNAPKSMPEIRLKSTDGEVNELAYVGYEGGIEYYFDKMIQYLDPSKKYYLEAILVTEDNIASLESRSQKLKLGNQKIGEFNNIKVVAENNNFVMQYIGTINTELISLDLIQNATGDNYISGYIYVAEWINGECKTPYAIPQIKIKSTDGTFETNAYVGYEGNIKYYFDKCITDFDITKQYIIEVSLLSNNNIATEEQKTQQVSIPNMTVGKHDTIVVSTQNNKIIISDSSLYYGTINTELHDINIIQNAAGDNYISGYIYIAEWVDGNCNTPKEMPEIRLKSTDGEVDLVTYIGYESGIEYYFDKDIEGLDTSKEYYLEVKLQGKKNIAEEESKKQVAKITEQGQIGTCTNGNKVEVEGNIITIKPDLYYGTINTELHDINVIQNTAGDNYISGYIYIAEWVDGNCNTPKEMPEIRLKSTDGEVDLVTYIGYESGIEYYFDKCIEGLDTNKEYYLEVKLQGSNNTADEASKKQVAKITEQGEIGTCTNGNKVKVEGNYITFEKVIRELNLEIETKKQEKENVEENIEKETNELVTNEIKTEKEIETEVEENEENIEKENYIAGGNIVEDEKNNVLNNETEIGTNIVSENVIY